ncbi:hypothetical protein [Streptomyces sp. AM6-12]|uniref:hypothetical protein n=1 Tax=Streptomyces sp. AM6-12 TaxID=3345149 RepID=UPI0037906766
MTTRRHGPHSSHQQRFSENHCAGREGLALPMLARYAKCLDGWQDDANRRIEDLLREYE